MYFASDIEKAAEKWLGKSVTSDGWTKADLKESMAEWLGESKADDAVAKIRLAEFKKKTDNALASKGIKYAVSDWAGGFVVEGCNLNSKFEGKNESEKGYFILFFHANDNYGKPGTAYADLQYDGNNDFHEDVKFKSLEDGFAFLLDKNRFEAEVEKAWAKKSAKLGESNGDFADGKYHCSLCRQPISKWAKDNYGGICSSCLTKKEKEKDFSMTDWMKKYKESLEEGEDPGVCQEDKDLANELRKWAMIIWGAKVIHLHVQKAKSAVNNPKIEALLKEKGYKYSIETSSNGATGFRIEYSKPIYAYQLKEQLSEAEVSTEYEVTKELLKAVDYASEGLLSASMYFKRVYQVDDALPTGIKYPQFFVEMVKAVEKFDQSRNAFRDFLVQNLKPNLGEKISASKGLDLKPYRKMFESEILDESQSENLNEHKIFGNIDNVYKWFSTFDDSGMRKQAEDLFEDLKAKAKELSKNPSDADSLLKNFSDSLIAAHDHYKDVVQTLANAHDVCHRFLYRRR
jgi:hypothetical protein